MAGKNTTLILKVDLECCQCKKKIRRVLCRVQDEVNITGISYDERSGTVVVSGVFDAERVSRKLKCKAGRVIKNIEEKKEEKKKEEKKEEKKIEEKKEEKKKEEKKEEKIKIEISPNLYFWPPGPDQCCHRPNLESYHGRCRCCSCGRATEEQPPAVSYLPTPYYYPVPYNTSQCFCEEDYSTSSCTLM